MKSFVAINGNIVGKEAASLGINDLGLLRGYGIFDFFKTIHNQPVWLEDHLDRFYFSAAEMHLPVPLGRQALVQLIRELMDRNGLPDSGIRMTLTGGYSDDGYTVQEPNLLITQDFLTYNPESFEKGIKLVTYEHQRQLPQVKTIDYLQAIRLQSFVRAHNADDLLYYNQHSVLESPRSNFFIVNQQDEIVTASDNVLQGITRKKILAMEGIDIKAGTISLDALPAAKEAFLTSTTRRILPVLAIDGNMIGDGKPGKITREIREKLHGLMNNESR